MNDLASKLIVEAVLRALHKNPEDLPFYQERVTNPAMELAYRLSLQKAVEEWAELRKIERAR